MSKYTVAIVGLGQVAQGYDYHNSHDNLILTHATALQFHNDFELIAAVDSSQEQRDKFNKKFSTPVFSNLKDLYLAYSPDIVVIAVPTKYHFDVCLDVIKHSPKAIVLEKPVASNYADAKELLKISTDKKIQVSVNYLRRFNPALQTLKEVIARKELGKVYKGVVWYTKGIVNNGSHFIDLFTWLLGDVTSIKVLNNNRSWDNTDPEPDLCIRFGCTDMYMLSGHEESFYMGKFELIGDNGAAFYEDGQSIDIHLSQNDKVYDGYKELVKDGQIVNPSEINMSFIYDNLFDHLVNGAQIVSDIDTATKTMLTIQKILKKLRMHNGE